MKGYKKMEVCRIILKIIMWVLIGGFGCNFIMQTISYSFYKGAKQMNKVSFSPIKIQLSGKLTGYGYNLDAKADKIILFFGGSNYIAYNSVGNYGGKYDCPFISADYYGTQDSKGKMNIKSMQQTAVDLYNKIIPIFWGPAKIFISNNIQLTEYAKNTTCKTYIISSTSDKTLGVNLQKKVQNCYKNAKIMIFKNVEHENYLIDGQVINYVKSVISNE